MRTDEVPPLPNPDDPSAPAPQTATLAQFDEHQGLGPISEETHRRPIRYKFLAIVIVASAAAALLIDVVHDLQLQRMAGMYLKRARDARSEERLPESTLNLRRYIRLMPDDVEARTELAFTLDEIAETPSQRLEVFLMLERILRDDSERRGVRRKLVDLAMTYGRYTDAIVHLKLLLYADASDAELLGLIARCYEKDGKPAEAEAAYRAAIHTAPREFENYEQLATLLAERLNREEDAEQIMNELISANRRSYQAYLSRARFWQTRGRTEHALADARRAFQLAPDRPDVLVLASNVLACRSATVDADGSLNPQEVRRGLQRALVQHGESIPLLQSLAQLDVLVGRADLAESGLRKGLVDHPDNRELLWSLADVLSSQEKLDEARDVIGRLTELNVSTDLIAYLEARVAIAEGDWLAACRKLESIRSGRLQRPQLQVQINLNLGLCYRQLGLREQQLDAFRRVVDLNSLSVEGRLQLADTLAQSGRIEDALLNYRQVMEQPGVPIKVARLIMADQLRRPPRERDWTEIEQLLNRAGRQPDSLIDTLLLRAEALMAQQRYDAARELLERSVERHAGQASLWVALATLHDRMGHPELADEVYRNAGERLGPRVEFQLARALRAASRNRDEALATLRELEEARVRMSDDNRRRLVPGLARAYQQLGAVEPAERLFREVAATAPNDVLIWQRLLELAIQAESDEKAQLALIEIERIEGEKGVYWQLGEASRLIMLARSDDPSRLGAARELLAAVAGQKRLLREVSLALAEIEELAGSEELLIQHYRDAIERGERRPHIVFRVVELLNKRQRYYDAEQVIQKFREQSVAPLSPEFGRLAVQVSMHTKDYERALDLARTTVSADSKDYRDLIWLGNVLWTAGQLEESEQALRRAIELARSRPEPWVALIAYLQRVGRTDEAQRTIDEARTHWPSEETELTLAQCYDVLGQLDLARKHYLSAMAADADNPRIVWSAAGFLLRAGDGKTARPLLERLTGLDSEHALTDVDEPILSQARRALSLLLVVDGGYRGFQTASALIAKNLESPERSPGDLRVKAKLLATRPSRRLRREAIRILLDLDETAGLNPADRFQLIRLYVAVGNWSMARDAMTVLLSVHDNQPDYVAYCVRQAVLRGESDAAVRQWLEVLARLEPDAFRTHELRARLQLALTGVDAALEIFDAYQRGASTPADVRTSRLEQVAGALADMARNLELLGRTAEADRLALQAERCYRDLIAVRPERSLSLVRLLGQQWKMDEAFEVCRLAWDSVPSGAVAVASVELLQSGRATPEQFRDVRSRIAQALVKEPNSPELLFQLANVHQLLGEYPEAIRLYRRTLEAAADAVPALNELALLLTLSQDEPSEALDHINRAIELSGPLPMLLDTRATIYVSLGRTREALGDLEAAIDDAPTPAKHFHLAQARMASQDAAAAKLAYHAGIAAGLHSNNLHPLERPLLEQLRTSLETN